MLRLLEFEKGYLERDISRVKNWAENLLDKEVQIIGTNSVYPGDFEWRTGHTAAIEMFENDWKNWGDLLLFLDQAEINVENNSSWVAIFGIASRNTPEEENRTFESSKSRVLNRIKSYTEAAIPSTLALYQIISDASTILHQYEQSEIFVWPLRISLSFTKKNQKWMIKQIHFSWPGRGFPVVRLLE